MYSPLSFLPCFSSQFCFNCHIPCTTYLPLLFAHFVVFLSCFVRFVITCTTFLPFPCFIYFYPTVQCCLTHVDFALSASLLFILSLPYTFYCLSSFILSPIFSLSCLPFSSSSFLLLCFFCFLHLLVFLCTDLSPMKMKTGKILRSQVRCPPLPTHSIVLKR